MHVRFTTRCTNTLKRGSNMAGLSDIVCRVAERRTRSACRHLSAMSGMSGVNIKRNNMETAPYTCPLRFFRRMTLTSLPSTQRSPVATHDALLKTPARRTPRAPSAFVGTVQHPSMCRGPRPMVRGRRMPKGSNLHAPSNPSNHRTTSRPDWAPRPAPWLASPRPWTLPPAAGRQPPSTIARRPVTLAGNPVSLEIA
jgi:hypothetical protein